MGHNQVHVLPFNQVTLIISVVISTSFNKFGRGKCLKSVNLWGSENCLTSVNSWNYGNHHGALTGLWGELWLCHFHQIQPMECSFGALYSHSKHARVTNDNRSLAGLQDVKGAWIGASLIWRVQNASLHWISCKDTHLNFNLFNFYIVLGFS